MATSQQEQQYAKKLGVLLFTAENPPPWEPKTIALKGTYKELKKSLKEIERVYMPFTEIYYPHGLYRKHVIKGPEKVNANFMILYRMKERGDKEETTIFHEKPVLLKWTNYLWVQDTAQTKNIRVQKEIIYPGSLPPKCRMGKHRLARSLSWHERNKY